MPPAIGAFRSNEGDSLTAAAVAGEIHIQEHNTAMSNIMRATAAADAPENNMVKGDEKLSALNSDANTSESTETALE